jgi:hypothetical protein
MGRPQPTLDDPNRSVGQIQEIQSPRIARLSLQVSF